MRRAHQLLMLGAMLCAIPALGCSMLIVESQTAGIPDLPTMAELTKSAPETVTISATADEDGKEARSSAKWIVIVLALIALSAIALFSRRRE